MPTTGAFFIGAAIANWNWQRLLSSSTSVLTSEPPVVGQFMLIVFRSTKERPFAERKTTKLTEN